MYYEQNYLVLEINFLKKKNHYLPGSPIILKVQPNVNDATIIKIIS